MLALRTNCTTASLPAGRSPTPSLFASSSIFDAWQLATLLAQVDPPNTTRVSPSAVPLPVSRTLFVVVAVTPASNVQPLDARYSVLP